MAAGPGVCARKGEAVRACAAVASLFLSPAAASSAELSGRKAVGRLSSSQPASPACPGPVHGQRSGSCLPVLLSWLCTLPGATVPGVAGNLRLCPTIQSQHISEVPHCRLYAVLQGPSPEESSLTAAFALAGGSVAFFRSLELQPGSLLRPFPRQSGRRWSPELTTSHPHLPEVCLPPLPGWRKCALGRLIAGAPTRRLVPAGPGQVVGRHV